MFKIANFINKKMIPLLILVIILGLAFGYNFPNISAKLQPFVPVTLFIMLYPMMIGMRFGEIKKAFLQWKLTAVAMTLNFVVSPLLAAYLAKIFLLSQPDFAVGLILTGVVPCAGMVIAWTGMAKGNSAFTLVITALSLLAAIVMIPIWMSVLADAYVAVDAVQMIKNILIVVVIPLLLGNLTRVYLVKKKGTEGFQQLKPVLPAVSALGMYLIFFISMSTEAVELLNHPEYLLQIGIPLSIFYVLMLTIPLLYAKLTQMAYEDMVALVYSVLGKNISIALALAVVFFSSKTVMIIAIKPLIQVIFMIGFLRLTKLLGRHWGRTDIDIENGNLT